MLPKQNSVFLTALLMSRTDEMQAACLFRS